MRSITRWVETFLFPPASDRWVTILRIGLGVQTTLYSWSLRRDWNVLFRSNGRGVVSRDLQEAILDAQSRAIPRLGWLVHLGGRLGLSEDLALSTVWVLLFCAGALLLLGLLSRTAAVTAWFLHLCAVKSGSLVVYGMDNFTTIGLFYLMLCPLPDRKAIDYRIWKQRPKHRDLLGFVQRLLQLHLCIIYFSSGLAKSLGAGWWNGTSLWRALSSPPFDIIPAHTLVTFAWALPLLGIGVFLLELGYPFFIWPKQTRLLWLAGTLGMHAAIAMTMGLYLFASIMIILNLAAFGPGLNRWHRVEFSQADRHSRDEVVAG